MVEQTCNQQMEGSAPSQVPCSNLRQVIHTSVPSVTKHQYIGTGLHVVRAVMPVPGKVTVGLVRGNGSLLQKANNLTGKYCIICLPSPKRLFFSWCLSVDLSVCWHFT